MKHIDNLDELLDYFKTNSFNDYLVLSLSTDIVLNYNQIIEILNSLGYSLPIKTLTNILPEGYIVLVKKTGNVTAHDTISHLCYFYNFVDCGICMNISLFIEYYSYCYENK